jgi:Kef-type K+ transport system membrane component KefB
VLLFEVGLESNPAELGRAGPRAAGIAVVGVVASYVLAEARRARNAVLE